MTGGIPVRFRGRARRDAAAFYLSQLAKGVLSGELAVVSGEQATSLVTTEYLLLDIEVKQKKRANHVAMKLRWPRRPLIRAGGKFRSSEAAAGNTHEGGGDGES
ncbi:MAG TPA: amphi-Trp domain-containing protein [Methylomirabilota bacterium]